MQAETSAQSLSETKDKAQAAATWGMSILNIALLKSVIENGKSSTYYIPGIIIIIIAIVLQVIVGALALRVAIANRFYKRFNDHLSDENNCCCRKNGEEIEVNVTFILSQLDKDMLDLFVIIKKSQAKSTAAGRRPNRSNVVHPMSREKEFFEWHEIWQIIQNVCDLRSNGSQEELKVIQRNIDLQIAELTRRTKALDKLKFVTGQAASQKRIMLGTLIKKLGVEIGKGEARLLVKRQEANRIKEHQNSLRKQGEVLQKYVNAATKEKVYKSSNKWQNAINYILYSIFILNAVIVGFGMDYG